jgi:two-component system, OmpR family, phosphate regulon sensor histidine kinase PhoR
MAIKQSPKRQSFFIATAVSVFYAVACAMLYIFNYRGSLAWTAGLGVLLWGATYLVVHKVFLDYVEQRLNPIFKTIHSVTLSKGKIRKNIDAKNFSENLDREVKVWAAHQNNEIRQLREMEKYRKDFLGNVSHELKTPIFNIQGYILTLLDGGIDDPKINTLYLKRAEKSVNRMITIVDDLVSISRLESGEFKLQMERFNIVRLVEEVFESHEMLTRNYRIKLEFNRNYTKPIKVYADKKRITEVLNNLIVNSIKYGSSNGKTRVGFSEADGIILVDVSDNGIGIAEEDLPRIFERFYRVDKSRSRDSGGTGLGLAIVKHIIQAHNQSINVRSATGTGTSFVFTLEKG